LENLAMTNAFWCGKRVLVTGHTGFKGGWLVFWLRERGAEVAGIGLAPSSEPSLFDLLRIQDRCSSTIGDINELGVLDSLIQSFKPEVIIHLAAQALVRESYVDPVGTYDTNVMGVVRLLDSARRSMALRSIVVVTSDKCYENREQIWGYREGDHLGGHDPYSGSKGAAEIAAQSMQRSFFRPFAKNGHPARIATVRAGNVIGGGDWSVDRLVPDIVRGILADDGEVLLRNPGAIRPWQHVLEPLSAYLRIAELLETGSQSVDEAWNIGPDFDDMRTVEEVAEALIAALGKGRIVTRPVPDQPHEANLLMLDCAKAKVKLKWQPRLHFEDCIRLTAEWYSAWYGGSDMTAFTRLQLAHFEEMDVRPVLRGAHSKHEAL
jgi:CDP-glucose 4,6-dehydratase